MIGVIETANEIADDWLAGERHEAMLRLKEIAITTSSMVAIAVAVGAYSRLRQLEDNVGHPLHTIAISFLEQLRKDAIRVVATKI